MKGKQIRKQLFDFTVFIIFVYVTFSFSHFHAGFLSVPPIWFDIS